MPFAITGGGAPALLRAAALRKAPRRGKGWRRCSVQPCQDYTPFCVFVDKPPSMFRPELQFKVLSHLIVAKRH
eukprot:6312055-Pyramimonas_sp.AAC.1